MTPRDMEPDEPDEPELFRKEVVLITDEVIDCELDDDVAHTDVAHTPTAEREPDRDHDGLPDNPAAYRVPS